MQRFIAGFLPLFLACCGSADKGNDAAASAAATEPPATASSAPATGGGKVLATDCGMGVCFVSVVRDYEFVNESSTGKLYKVMMSGAEVDESVVGDGGQVDISKITFGDDSFNYVFCSRTLPSVIYASNNGFDAKVLGFGGSVPHSDESAANLYVHICHPNDDWQDNGFAKRHGYISDIGPSPSIRLNLPTDILSYSPSKSDNGELKLSGVNDSDWDQIGMGCSCSFSKSKQTLLALGSNGFIIRPDGQRRICAPPVDAYPTVVQGDGILDCGNAKIEISNIKDKRWNGDGYDSSARLRVEYGGKSMSATGELSCAC